MSKDTENQCRVRTITVILASVMCFQDNENLVRMTDTRFFFYRRGPIIFCAQLSFFFSLQILIVNQDDSDDITNSFLCCIFL